MRNVFREMNDLNDQVAKVRDKGAKWHCRQSSLKQTKICCLGAKAGKMHKEKAMSSECTKQHKDTKFDSSKVDLNERENVYSEYKEKLQ